MGYKHIQLETYSKNTKARTFYERLGFDVIKVKKSLMMKISGYGRLITMRLDVKQRLVIKMEKKRALVVFLSITGNTEKVANSIHAGLTEGGFEPTLKRVQDAANEDFYYYDLVCFGSPSYNWHLPKPADDFLKTKFNEYKKAGRVIPGAPILPGKNCLVFCTYSGPHTGIREAIPAGKYIGQFFEHFGFTVVDEWYILSEFVGSEENNTMGRMGNIKGLPSEQDLERVKQSAYNLSKRL